MGNGESQGMVELDVEGELYILCLLEDGLKRSSRGSMNRF